MDVIDGAALLVEFTHQVGCAGSSLLELLAKIIVDLLDVLPTPGLTAESLSDHEAEGTLFITVFDRQPGEWIASERCDTVSLNMSVL